MARGVGSKYDFATVDQLQRHVVALHKRLDAVSFDAGEQIGRVSRLTDERITNLDNDQRDMQRSFARLIMRLRALEWEVRHPWRTRWVRVRAFVAAVFTSAR